MTSIPQTNNNYYKDFYNAKDFIKDTISTMMLNKPKSWA